MHDFVLNRPYDMIEWLDFVLLHVLTVLLIIVLIVT